MKKEYIPVVMLICGILISAYMVPSVTNEAGNLNKRSWHILEESALGNLDSSYGTGNSSILAWWVVNHSSIADIQFDTNDSAGAFNASNTVYAYNQTTAFYNEVPQGISFDLVIFVRVNQTNAAESATTHNFNDTWVMVNFTSAILGCSGGVNLSGIICTNTSGFPFMYMMFVFNGTGTGIKLLKGWNNAMCGSGFSLSRNQIINDIVFKLQCFY